MPQAMVLIVPVVLGSTNSPSRSMGSEGGSARSSSGGAGGPMGPCYQHVVPHECRVLTALVALMEPVGPVARYPWEGVRREGRL